MSVMGVDMANGDGSKSRVRIEENSVGDGLALPKPGITDKLLTAHDVAEMIGMRTDYVYALSRRDQIPHLRFGRTLRFRRASIEKWVRAMETNTLPTSR